VVRFFGVFTAHFFSLFRAKLGDSWQKNFHWNEGLWRTTFFGLLFSAFKPKEKSKKPDIRFILLISDLKTCFVSEVHFGQQGFQGGGGFSSCGFCLPVIGVGACVF